MSEMRRAARRLVEPIVETYDSRHPLEESRRRLEAGLARIPARERADLAIEWIAREGLAVLRATFGPARRTRRFLMALSLAMAFFVGLTAWAATGATSRVFLYLSATWTVLAILGFPLVILGLASAKEAREARIRKAIRVALLGEEERLPPRQRWEDED